jgi:chromosome segregation ATPase
MRTIAIASAEINKLRERLSDANAELDNLLPLLHASERHKTQIVREFKECRKELVQMRDRVDELEDENSRLRTELEER